MSTSEGLTWTGERMIPNRCDAGTELFHWQRYLYFRPWYDGIRVVDAGSGEGYGANFIGHFAASCVGLDIDPAATEHARSTYSGVNFKTEDVTTRDYSDADLVVSFETIERLEDPIEFLRKLNSCPGRVVVSATNRLTHSPGNKLEDKPLNRFRTLEWTPNEFKEVVEDAFPGRTVRFLSQEGNWPGLIREGLDEDALYTIAVVGEGELPKYPKLGIAIPTVNNAQQLEEAIVTMIRYYPGEIEFAVVANGSNNGDLAKLRSLANGCPQFVTLLEQRENLGYGQGANLGLEYLFQKGNFDYYGVSNDDVLAAPTTMLEIVSIALQLKGAGQRVGLIGPVSNQVHGPQKVDVGDLKDLSSIAKNSDSYYRINRSRATVTPLIRGLFFLMTPECLHTVGGFDPMFGLGNFEDDDLCLRAHYSSFTNWVAQGSFLYHYGSQTFRGLGLDHAASIEQNLEVMCRKWGLVRKAGQLEMTPLSQEMARVVPLYMPLSGRRQLARAS